MAARPRLAEQPAETLCRKTSPRTPRGEFARKLNSNAATFDPF